MTDEATLPFTFSEPILTDRLVVRLMTPDDAVDVHAYQSREDVCRYLLFEPRTLDDVTTRVARHAEARTIAAEHDYWQLAIELPARADRPARVIGDIYFTVVSIENSRGEIGWTLHPEFFRRGYATEAASAVLDFVFTHLTLHRVVAELDPRNDASIALCRALGFREEAFFRSDILFKGDWADTGLYAILRDEWRGRTS